MGYAGSSTLVVVLLSIGLLASAADASECSGTKVHRLKLFEQGKTMHDVTRVFGITKESWKKGEGNILNAMLTETDDPKSKLLGHISGLAVNTADSIITEVVTIRFRNPDGDEALSESKLFLHGLLNMEQLVQDYAVTGGTREFTGAYGVLSFTPVDDCEGCRWMEGTVFVPDLSCLSATEPRRSSHFII